MTNDYPERACHARASNSLGVGCDCLGDCAGADDFGPGGQRAGSGAAPEYADHSQLLVVADAQGKFLPVARPAEWNVRRAHILAHFQEVAGALPGGERRVPLQMKVISETREPGYARRKVSFASEPGDRVPAWLLVPDSAGAASVARPAMLCLHQTIAVGKDEPAGLGGNRELAIAANWPSGATWRSLPIIPTSASTRSTLTT